MGSLSNDDDAMKTSQKMNLRPFNFIVSIWTRSICQMTAIFPGVEFLRILSNIQVKTEKEKFVLVVLFSMIRTNPDQRQR